MRDPETQAEWQAAVDAAYGALALESARLYGLVRGGPDVDVARCEEILNNGRSLGFLPGNGSIEDFMKGMLR